MIGDEIREILNAEKDRGLQLSDLVDTFRNGRPAKELLPLLAADESALVSVAVWILSELSEELYGTTEIVERLRQLTEHSDPQVRFYALSAVFPFLNSTDPSTRDLLSKLAQDTNEARTMACLMLNGVKFDGIKKGVLLEAKGPGYATFVRDGNFRDWFQARNRCSKAKA